jgi:hypothetical protein
VHGVERKLLSVRGLCAGLAVARDDARQRPSARLAFFAGVGCLRALPDTQRRLRLYAIGRWLQVSAARPDSRRHDLDNFAFKPVSDLLVSLGIVSDDSECTELSAR